MKEGKRGITVISLSANNIPPGSQYNIFYYFLINSDSDWRTDIEHDKDNFVLINQPMQGEERREAPRGREKKNYIV